MKNLILLFSLIFSMVLPSIAAQSAPQTLAQGDIAVQSFSMERVGDQVVVAMQQQLAALHVKADRFIAYTPVITGVNGEQMQLQSLVITRSEGRR